MQEVMEMNWMALVETLKFEPLGWMFVIVVPSIVVFIGICVCAGGDLLDNLVRVIEALRGVGLTKDESGG